MKLLTILSMFLLFSCGKNIDHNVTNTSKANVSISGEEIPMEAFSNLDNYTVLLHCAPVYKDKDPYIRVVRSETNPLDHNSEKGQWVTVWKYGDFEVTNSYHTNFSFNYSSGNKVDLKNENSEVIEVNDLKINLYIEVLDWNNYPNKVFKSFDDRDYKCKVY
jgi:hypothetical protein